MRWLLLCLLAGPAAADTVVPTRPIRAAELLSAEALGLAEGETPGAAERIEDIVGLEARITLYPGRPILYRDLLQPALVERNALISIVFDRGGLRISAEGRALGRGAAGDRIRVMNLASRSNLFGTVLPDGSVSVSE
ncbi:flagellar basal body P-ring formation chaperone FlgA [Litorisediminicola beolgyonensis]|uniref:Flagella basal body P-ring formation protein FlgA n=1 Tax=Litorisediminicola beolgyonensis TaxID=1173614 RepID=A0ABW3ZGE9_9RHOB